MATVPHPPIATSAPSEVEPDAVRAFTDGLEAAGHVVRSEGLDDPELLRAVAGAASQDTPFDRGWVRGLLVIAAAIQDGEWT